MAILVPVGPKKSQYTKLENQCITVLKTKATTFILSSFDGAEIKESSRKLFYPFAQSGSGLFFVHTDIHICLFGTL